MSRQKKEFEEYEINESYKTEERDNPYGFKRKSKEERPVLAICWILIRHYRQMICRHRAIFSL